MLVLAILGICTLLFTSWIEGSKLAIARWLLVSLEQVGGILIATALLSVFWELRGRRSLASEVMETANLAHDVREAGLERVWNRYLTEEAWSSRFRRAQKLDIFVAYANTWREGNRLELSAFAMRKSNVVRVVLPDVLDAPTVSAIALRSGKTAEEVVQKVCEARMKYRTLLQHGENCSILSYRGPQAYAVYRFDEEAVVTLYRNSPAKTGHIPTLSFTGGTLGEFVNSDLDQVIANSTVWWTSQT